MEEINHHIKDDLLKGFGYLIVREIQSIDNKDAEASDRIQTEAGEKSPGNAVIAGLLQLILDVGPLVNMVAVALLAYRIDPRLAIYVILLYLGIQYLVSRLLKDRTEARIVNVKPALGNGVRARF